MPRGLVRSLTWETIFYYRFYVKLWRGVCFDMMFCIVWFILKSGLQIILHVLLLVGHGVHEICGHADDWNCM